MLGRHFPQQAFIYLLTGCLVFFGTARAETDTQSLSILSWNVWFDDETGHWRYPLILDEINRQDADIVTLQETTTLFISLLKNHALIKQYHITLSQQGASYQNLTLSKKVPNSQQVLRLESYQGRKALLLEISSPALCEPLSIANVHLESPLDDEYLRTQQLQQITQLLGNHNPAIIAGDFNFGNGATEEKSIPQAYQDAASQDNWKNEVTYNIEQNSWAEQTKYWFESSRRLDRIYSLLPQAKQGQYQLIGQTPHSNGKYLSDHFGIKYSVEFSGKPHCPE